jgi:hypothetical protein
MVMVQIDGSALTGIAGGGSSAVWYDGTTYITSSVDVQITGSLQHIQIRFNCI